MAITISGANNVDKILATDGVLDSISGFNVVGVMTAGTFDVTGKTTTGHLNIGSNIQLGNAGIITATTLIGNVTGNINASSTLLLQTGGSERFRIASAGQLGIGGANYGSAGQVLTSGGSGSAATWSTIASDKITEGNTEAEVVDTGSDGYFKVTTEGSERLRVSADGNVTVGAAVTISPVGNINATGIITATSYRGDGSQLTGITGTTINNYASTRIVTATNNANELDAETNLTVNGSLVTFADSTLVVNKGTNPTVTVKETAGNKEAQFRADTTGGLLRTVGNYPLIFGVNQSEKVRITNAGNLGVGDNDPDLRLCVLDSGENMIRIGRSDGTGHGSENVMVKVSHAVYNNYKMEASSFKLYSYDGSTMRQMIDFGGTINLFKQQLKVDYAVSGSDYVASFVNQNANCYGVSIKQPASANAGYPLLSVANNSGQSHFRVDSAGLVYANSGTGTDKPAYFVRAWVQGNSGTTNGSGGLSSMSRVNTGRFQLNFTTTMPDDNYAVGCLANNNYSDTSWFDTSDVDRVRVYFYSNGSYQDPSEWSAWVIR